MVNLSGATGGAVITDAQGVGTITDGDATADRRAALAAWTSPVGVTSPVGALTKTEAAGWNAGAASAQALLDGDGSLEFTASETTTTRLAGLSRGNTNTDFADVDFGLYLHSNASVYVVEGGVTRNGGVPVGSYATGDRFGVGVENGVVVYRQNGVVLYTSAVPPVYPLLVDTALYTTGGDADRRRAERPVRAAGGVDQPRGHGRHGRLADEDRRERLERGRGLDARARLGRRLRGVHRDGDDHDADAGPQPRQQQPGLMRTSTSASSCTATPRSTWSREASRGTGARPSGPTRRAIGSRWRLKPGWWSTGATACCSTRAASRRCIRCWWTRRSTRPARGWPRSSCRGRSRPTWRSRGRWAPTPAGTR